MSFFDEGDEPPTRTQPRTRRAPAAARSGGGGGGGARGGGVDPAIRQRRLIALAFGVLLIIIFAIGVRSCVNSAGDNQAKDYNQAVGSVIAQSDRDVGRPLFELLGQSGQSPVELETQINQLSSVAARQLSDAEGFDVPDDLEGAQHNLLLTLDLRETGVRKIASQVRTALADSDEAEAAQTQIASQMQSFLASDVVYRQRVLPYVEEYVAGDRGIANQQYQQTQFLPDLSWLEPGTVADRLGGGGGGGSDSGSADEGDVAPGLHGHGLESVAIGDTTLQPGEVVNRVPAGSGLAINVSVANQGENPEEDVKVSVRITGSGKPITASRNIDATEPGTTAQIAIPIETQPAIGRALQLTVSVAKVGGEEKTDNNRQTYTVFFTS